MPIDLFSRLDLDALYPPFLEKALQLAANCRAKGVDYYALTGFRSQAEQARLYFQGRTTPGARVTNARPGLSPHNYGIAVDFCRDAALAQPGLQPDWVTADYALLKQEGEALGLQVGVPSLPGGDAGHVQLNITTKTRRKEVGLLADLRATPNMQRAWSMLDAWGFGGG